MEETKVYIKRKADQYLAEWKADSQRKPLIVKGARQIGREIVNCCGLKFESA